MYGKYKLQPEDLSKIRSMMFQPSKFNLLEMAKITIPILGLILLKIKILSNEEIKSNKDIENLFNSFSGLKMYDVNCQAILNEKEEKIAELLCKISVQLPYTRDLGINAFQNKSFMQVLLDTAYYLTDKLPEDENNLVNSMLTFLQSKFGMHQSALYTKIESALRQPTYSIKTADAYLTLIYFSLESYCKEQNDSKMNAEL